MARSRSRLDLRQAGGGRRDLRLALGDLLGGGDGAALGALERLASAADLLPLGVGLGDAGVGVRRLGAGLRGGEARLGLGEARLGRLGVDFGEHVARS